jgi:ion channel POLLUX/CASTOR
VAYRRENREPNRWARARYRANRFWDRGTWPVLLAVGALTLLIVLASTAVLVITNSVFTTEHSRSVAERFWQSLLRVIDPGTMATDLGWGPRLLSLVVTIAGIVLFGTLIGTISTRMQLRLGTLRRGRTIVLESGHIVILGWTPSIGLLVDDLTAAVRTRRRRIVILADEDRAAMEESLRDPRRDRRGRWLICRNGDPTIASELDRVNVRQARTVVAIGTEEPSSDATVAATVLAVGVACDGFANQTIVAEVDDPAAAQTLTDACNGQVEVVGDDVIADMLALWMARPGAAELMRELLSVQRIRLAFCDPPGAPGRSFSELVRSVDQARPIGISRADGSIELAPPPAAVPAPGELLVCLSDGAAVRWDLPGATPAPDPRAAASVSSSPRRLMLIGWNRIAPGLLSELDRLLPAGSSAVVLCDSDLVAAQEIAVPALDRLAVTITHVPDPELEIVSALADRPCSAIAVLAHQGVTPKDADAITLATLMAVGRVV